MARPIHDCPGPQPANDPELGYGPCGQDCACDYVARARAAFAVGLTPEYVNTALRRYVQLRRHRYSDPAARALVMLAMNASRETVDSALEAAADDIAYAGQHGWEL